MIDVGLEVVRSSAVMRATMVALTCVLLAAVAPPPVSAAPSPAARCAAAKLRAAAQKANKRAKCVAAGVLGREDRLSACLATVEAKFAATWAHIEGRGGCPTVGDEGQIEFVVNRFVNDLLLRLNPSTTTVTVTTTSTSQVTCPPTTALYCGHSGCAPPALCPPGMTCNSTTCACEGPAVPCGDLWGLLCEWGTCPAGMTCGMDPTSTECPPRCACH